MKKELVFLGAPASGKGTQTDLLSEHLGFPHIDTGSLLRAAIKAQTPEGLEAQKHMDQGHLVPVWLVGAIIKNRLSQDDCKNGYILDGYPRSMEQAAVLENINKELDKEPVDFRVIYFDINADVLLERIVNRRSCPKCGKIYNLKFLKPKEHGYCNECKTELIQRKDDTEETAKARFSTYFEQTAPLIKYYEDMGKLYKIDANGTIDEVWQRLLKVI
ncbi:adenylate kinase [bacterium]|nr:adenylate kinase [bacterium]